MNGLEGLARAMAAMRNDQPQPIVLTRTYASIIDEMPTPSGKRGMETNVLQRMQAYFAGKGEFAARLRRKVATGVSPSEAVQREGDRS